MRIVSVGGGPAGLYFAILMKRADPAHEITVLERNRPDDTFGFGGRLVDVNSLARSFWVVPIAVALLFGGTALGNSRMPDAQSHIESAERHLLNGDREGTLRELRAAIEVAARTGDTETLTRALTALRSLAR